MARRTDMNERDIFIAARQLHDPVEREAFLDKACAGDLGLRGQVIELLEEEARLGSFMEHNQPPAAPLDPPARETAGTVIGPYKLLEQIGEGGMGTVWMAQQTKSVKRLVALKLIKAGMDSKQVIARFEAERQALALMDHPNIARVLDAGTTNSGRPFFVMDLVKGMPITKFCDEHHLTPRERLELFLPVCQAVQHAHQKGIIHRDLKPTNVLIAHDDGKPVPKVIDFGVAKAAGQSLTDKTLLTGFGNIVGTLEYMSPEQARLDNQDIDTRSDVYSLGVLLYELLTGSTPLERRRLREVALLELLRVIQEEEPPKPSTRLGTAEELPSVAAQRHTEPAKLTRLVRGDLDWIVMKALEKDRNRRYESASGLALDVHRHLADEPVLAGPPTAVYRLRKFLRRNKGPVVGVVIVFLCLVIGVIGTSAALVWALHERDEKARALTAETQARKAEAQARDRAMTALRDLTNDVIENQLARGTQLTSVNKQFLRRVVTHFEGFAAISANDAESRAIRAEGHHRVAYMRHRLGELKEAEAAYDQALALRRQLVIEFPARSEFRQDLADTLHNLGRLKIETDRAKEGETAFVSALTLRKQLVDEFPSQPAYRQELAASLNNRGVQFHMAGKLKEAEEAYRDVVTLRTKLVAEFPDRLEYAHGLARTLNNLGWLLQSTSRQKEAELAYGQAIVLQKGLVAKDPSSTEYRQELASSQHNLGILLRTTGRSQKAEEAYAAALAIRRELAAEFPARPEFRQELANTLNSLGILLGADRLGQAEAAYKEAITLWEKLSREFPTRHEFRQGLARSYDNLGTVLRQSDRCEEAESISKKALALRRELLSKFPTDPERQDDLAVVCGNLAHLRLKKRDFRGAMTYFEEGLPHLRAALKTNPANPAYQDANLVHLAAYIQASAGLGNHAEALRGAEEMRDLPGDVSANVYQAARSLAMCIPIVRDGGNRATAERDKLVANYGDAAMRMLRDAIAKGFRRLDHLEKDRELDPLRDRDEFKELSAQVNAKQQPKKK